MIRCLFPAPGRRLGLAVALLGGLTLGAGCSNDGYGGKDFGQEFEKPAGYPTESVKEVDPPDDPEDLSPREKRSGEE